MNLEVQESKPEQLRAIAVWFKLLIEEKDKQLPEHLAVDYEIVHALRGIADRMEAMEKALRNISERHEWSENVGPCVCEAHEVARRILEKDSK